MEKSLVERLERLYAELDRVETSDPDEREMCMRLKADVRHVLDETAGGRQPELSGARRAASIDTRARRSDLPERGARHGSGRGRPGDTGPLADMERVSVAGATPARAGRATA
jgi:hypothetical protein